MIHLMKYAGQKKTHDAFSINTTPHVSWIFFYRDLMTEIQSIDDEDNDSFVLLILWYIKCFSAGEEDGFSPLYDGNDSLISSGSPTVRSGSYSVSTIEIIARVVDICNKPINDVKSSFSQLFITVLTIISRGRSPDPESRDGISPYL